MKELKRKVISIVILSAGILLTLVGLAGLFLPILPGFVLILAGLWMINKVYRNPWLDRIHGIVRQKRERVVKTILRKENN
jgi:uncharacterized protein YqgC (DUF456 family)